MTEVEEKNAALNANDMYSTAFGFYSRISSAVDPRTGMYTANVRLSTGEGNRLRGPRFEFRLSYNPLDVRDEGFGVGWRLGVTELDTEALMLTLSDGDQHKVEGLSPGQNARFPDRKLDSCTLRPGADLLSAVLTHATGVVEHLARPNVDAPRNPLRATRIVSVNGDSIRLEWTRDGRGNTCLSRVSDATDDADLLTIAYHDLNDITLRLYTGLDSPITMQFTRVGDLLTRIAIPLIAELNVEQLNHADDEAVWEFGYRNTLDAPVLRLLESVVSPDGIRDDVTYSERALQMPDRAPRAYMPAVLNHVRRSYHSGAVLQSSSYSYDLHGSRNFYGFPVVRQWVNRTDQLLHWAGAPFEYGSTETQFDGETPLRVIRRTYNHFHLATREVTTRGNLVQEVVIGYGTLPDRTFDDQPKAFQFPHKVTTTVYDTRSADMKQITVVDNTYDDNGHLLTRHESSSGITEESVYYPVSGEGELCPPDPLGIVTRLKSKTVRPGPGGGPVLTTTYRYCEVPVLAGATDYLDGRTVYVQACAETLTQEGVAQPLIQSTRSFFTDQGSQHGALSAESFTQDGLVENHTFTHRLDAASGTITTDTQRTTHDGIVLTSSETKLLISGLETSSTDHLGNRTDFEYDYLGRIARRVQAADEPADDPHYRTENGWQYQLSMSERWVRRVGISGLPHRTWLDEQERVTRQEEPLEDGRLMTVREVTYDISGQPTVEVVHDLLGARTLSLSTTSTYDDWGRPARVTAPDGSATICERSLVEADDDGEVMLRTIQWHETADGQRIGGWRSTDTDASGRLRNLRAGHWDGSHLRVAATGSWTYDGLGRCIEHTDGMSLGTQQTWDAFDRLVTTTLPDGDVVTRTYAAGHRGELLATIAITPKDGTPIVLGTRTHDGLGRLKAETAGSLTHRFTHIPGQVNPDTRQLPGGGTIKYTYDKRLNEMLTTETLEGRTQPMMDVTYDPQNRLPASLAAASGTMTIATDYLGRMTEQNTGLAGEPQRSSRVTVSPGGMVLTRIGVDGVVQTLDYDDVGRLASMADDDAAVTLTYDALSRLEVRTVVDTHSRARTVEQRLAYDDLGRVERTTWTHDEGDGRKRRVLVLTYREDDKVVGKRWLGETDDQLLREETMDYDARGRIVEHAIVSAVDGEYPLDEAGHAYRLQTFAHDALDNLLTVTTTLTDGRVNTTTYTYDAVDRDRVISVGNTLPGYPGHGLPVRLSYDDNGHLTDDGQGHTLAWDDAGRLSSVTLPNAVVLSYEYGPNGRIARIERPGNSTVRYHQSGALYCEYTGSDQRRFIRVRGAVVAETRLANAVRKTWLLGTDPQGSVLVENRPEG